MRIFLQSTKYLNYNSIFILSVGSIPGQVIPKTLKMVLDTSLLNTQQYKVCIKGIVEQSRERSRALPYTSVLWLLKGNLLFALDYGHQQLIEQNSFKYLC